MKKKPEPATLDELLDYRFELACHNCDGPVEITVREGRADIQRRCPSCGTMFDAKKSMVRLTERARAHSAKISEAIKRAKLLTDPSKPDRRPKKRD